MKPRLSILQVGSGMPRWGGTEVHIVRLCTALAERGHLVRIVCPRDSWLSEQATSRGFPVTHMRLRHTFDFRNLVPVLARTARHKATVVHTHSYRDYVIPALAARLTGVPCVVGTRHLHHPFRTRLRAFLCSNVLYDRLIGVSQSVCDSLVRSGAAQERVVAIPNSVDLRSFTGNRLLGRRIRDEARVGESTFLVGTVGRLTPIKGHVGLLTALSLLPRELPLMCLIVGDGPCRDSLEQLTSRLGLQDRVRFLDYRDDVPAILSALNVLVVPSTVPEAQSLAAIEALASGKPVIGFDSGGLPEVVRDGRNGYLAPYGNIRALSAAILKIFSQPDRGASMGQTGKQDVQGLSIEAMGEAMERLYLTVLGEKGWNASPPRR